MQTRSRPGFGLRHGKAAWQLCFLLFLQLPYVSYFKGRLIPKLEKSSTERTQLFPFNLADTVCSHTMPANSPASRLEGQALEFDYRQGPQGWSNSEKAINFFLVFKHPLRRHAGTFPAHCSKPLHGLLYCWPRAVEIKGRPWLCLAEGS